eukprot:m.387930 g.387930  ORF g.387930 m.387930 type:complete len:76 (-) comp21040_c0_seq3:304-531(-)
MLASILHAHTLQHAKPTAGKTVPSSQATHYEEQHRDADCPRRGDYSAVPVQSPATWTLVHNVCVAPARHYTGCAL